MAQAAMIAQKGLSGLFTLTKSGISAMSDAHKKTKAAYADYHEKDALASLKKEGVQPIDLVVASLQRLFYLLCAGYKNELVATTETIAKRLLSEGSSLQLDTVLIISRICEEEALARANFEQSGFTAKFTTKLKTFIDPSQTAKDHADREQLTRDFYYGFLLMSEICGPKGAGLAGAVRGAVLKFIESNPLATASSEKISSGAPAVAQATAGVAAVTLTSPIMVSEETDPIRFKLLKALYMFSNVLRKEAEAAEEARVRKVREAEETLRKEQARMHGGI